MVKFSKLLSIAKQRAANVFGPRKEDKADNNRTQKLPLTNKDLLSESNNNQGLVLRANERQNLVTNKKRNSAEIGLLCSVQIPVKNMPKLLLYKIPSWITYSKESVEGESNMPEVVMEQIVDKDLHTSLANMWERLQKDYTFPPHETIALNKLFGKQLDATRWRKGSDVIIDFQISMGKSILANDNNHSLVVTTKCSLDIAAETFQLIYVAPQIGETEQHKLLTVRHLDEVPIVATQKCFKLTNLLIALCYLLQWPAYSWLLASLLLWKTDKPPMEIKIACPFVFVGFFISFMRFFYAFIPVCMFITVLSNVCPKQAFCIQMVRVGAAISTLTLHAGYPLLKHCFQLKPLFVYIFPTSTSDVIIATTFFACILLLLILTCATECIIFFGYVQKYVEKWEKNEAICPERELAQGFWKALDTNRNNQAEIINDLTMIYLWK